MSFGLVKLIRERLSGTGLSRAHVPQALDLFDQFVDTLNDLDDVVQTHHKAVVSPARARDLPGPEQPSPARYGNTYALEFTVDNDQAGRLFRMPPDSDLSTVRFHIHWTKSQDTDQSGKRVKWRIDVTHFNGYSDDVAVAGEQLELEDVYDDDGTTEHIGYTTGDFSAPTIPGAGYLAVNVTAVAPSANALAEPALLSVDMTWDSFKNRRVLNWE